jgi:hypothetical protein
MDIKQVKYNLNKPVRLKLRMHNIGGDRFILTGCIIRRKKDTGDFYYQAEVSETKTSTVYYTSLDDISAEGEGDD